MREVKYLNKKLYYLKVSLDLHWGFLVRKTLASKTRETFIIPPPTTFIGALAYGYARLKNLPEEQDELSTGEIIREKTLSVNVKVNTPIIHYSDINRIWWYREREQMAKTDAVAIGKTYKGLKGTTEKKPDIDVIYVFKDHVKLEEINQLRLAAYSMVRLGGSHGLVSVRQVLDGIAEPLDTACEKTGYSFWADLSVKPLPAKILKQLVVDPAKNPLGNYVNALYREQAYPFRVDTLKQEEIEVEVDRSRASFYRVGGALVIVEHQIDNRIAI